MEQYRDGRYLCVYSISHGSDNRDVLLRPALSMHGRDQLTWKARHSREVTLAILEDIVVGEGWHLWILISVGHISRMLVRFIWMAVDDCSRTE